MDVSHEILISLHHQQACEGKRKWEFYAQVVEETKPTLKAQVRGLCCPEPFPVVLKIFPEMGAAHYYYPELFSVLKGTCAFPFPVHSFSTLYEYTPAKYVPLMISFHSETMQFPYRSMFLVV